MKKFLFEIVSRCLKHVRSQARSANHHMSCIYILGNFCVLLGIHFTKYYRFECEFYLNTIVLVKFSKNVLSLIESRNCASVTRSSLSCLHVASLEAKIEQICFSDVSTGL